MAFLMSILTIFFLMFYVNIVSSSNNITQFDNYTIEWLNFSLFSCAVREKINVSLFNCIAPNYTQVDDISCLQETNFVFQETTCQFTTMTITTLTSSERNTTQSSSTSTTTTISSSTTETTKSTTVSTSTLSTTTRNISTSIATENPFYCPADTIGSYCNITSDACAMSQPCLNAATCYPNNTLSLGYECQCQSGYTGQNCQNDERICKQNTCWNNGICIEINSTISGGNSLSFHCDCEEGYNGINCEFRADLCGNITCLNNGRCVTVGITWKCICLDPTFYYGDYCQYQTSTLKVRKALSKSFASIAITAIVFTCSFIILLDILKYGFHIDPIKDEREKYRIQQKEAKQAAKFKTPHVAIRFHYVS